MGGSGYGAGPAAAVLALIAAQPGREDVHTSFEQLLAVATEAAGAARPASLGYLAQIARAAEDVGFEGALTPTGAWCEDAWLTTAMLAAESERLKFLVAFRPGIVSPNRAGGVEHPDKAAPTLGADTSAILATLG